MRRTTSVQAAMCISFLIGIIPPIVIGGILHIALPAGVWASVTAAQGLIHIWAFNRLERLTRDPA
jgi:hypothetical protein